MARQPPPPEGILRCRDRLPAEAGALWSSTSISGRVWAKLVSGPVGRGVHLGCAVRAWDSGPLLPNVGAFIDLERIRAQMASINDWAGPKQQPWRRAQGRRNCGAKAHDAMAGGRVALGLLVLLLAFSVGDQGVFHRSQLLRFINARGSLTATDFSVVLIKANYIP